MVSICVNPGNLVGKGGGWEWVSGREMARVLQDFGIEPNQKQ